MNYHENDRSGWRLAKGCFTLVRWFVAYLVIHVCIAYGQNTQYEEDAESQVAAILVFSAIYVLLHVVNYIINQTIDSDGSGDRRAKGNVGSVILVIILLITTLVWYCQPGQYAAYRRNDKQVLMEREAARKEAEQKAAKKAEKEAAKKAEKEAAREAAKRASARKSSSSSGSAGSGTTRSASQNASYSSGSGGKIYSSSSKSSSTGVKSYSSSKSSGSSSKSSSGKTYRNLNPYENYDDGYEAIYYDGEYDQDRYDRDPEYAEGVDDAMDELDEDG